MHKLHRLARLLSVPLLLLFSFFSFAQAPRIRGPIESSPSVTLEGSLNPHVRIADDLGPLAPETAIRGVTLVFKRSTAQETDLQQLLAQQTDPSSPLFHHWLTPDEFATRFGVADEDLAATETWLQSRGFTVDDVSRSRDRITFSGNAAQIHQAFGAELHHFREHAGDTAELHFAPASEISLPPALAPLTAAVLHLSDFRPRPNVRPQPQYTTASKQTHFLAPKDLFTLYDLGPLNNSSDYATGQGLVIVGESYVPTGSGSALSNFQANTTQYTAVSPVLVPGSGSEAVLGGAEGEADIDLEYSSGIAQNANIFYVYSGSAPNYSVNDAISFSITQDIAPVISISYSECETLISASEIQQQNALFEQAAAQGQTVVVASGDSGGTACVRGGSSLPTAQQEALAVNFPASSPYVTAVGGTQMALGTFSAGTSQYWASASNIDNTSSLLSYVPEVTWNEDSSTSIFSSSGGPSSVFARPSWQTGVPGIPSGAFRLVPDVALQASEANPGFLICSEDETLTGASSDCDDGLVNSNNTYVLNGGTSFAAPVMAGFIALLNGYQHSAGQGNINPILYSLAGQPSIYSAAFHDISVGTSACASGDADCGAAGQSNYAAGVGYDQATGLGSVDFGQLAFVWPSGNVSTLEPTSVLIEDNLNSIQPGSTVPVLIFVGSSALPLNLGPPSGAVSVSIDGQIANASLTLTPSGSYNSQSSATYSYVTPSTPGYHILIARYPGDAAHQASSSTFAILVGSVTATGSITLSANNLTVSANGTGSTEINITPAGGYNGALTWSSNYTGGTSAQTICYLVQAPPIAGPTTATLQIGVGTACNSPSALKIPSSVQQASSSPLPAFRKGPAITVLALLLYGLWPSRRRRLLPLLCAVTVTVLPLVIIGCGGGGSNGGGGGGGGGPQPQVYTVTIRAQDSVNANVNASTNLTLTVD